MWILVGFAVLVWLILTAIGNKAHRREVNEAHARAVLRELNRRSLQVEKRNAWNRYKYNLRHAKTNEERNRLCQEQHERTLEFARRELSL